MFKFRILPIVVGLPLLVSSCAPKPGKYDLTGIWSAECYQPGANSKYTTKTVYSPDGFFETQSTAKFIFTYTVSFSGTYKADKNKLKETITNSSVPTNRSSLPQIQTSDLKWIDDHSVAVTTGNTKCTAIRLAKN